MADALHQFRIGAPRQFLQSGITGLPFPNPGADLDQLVVLQGALELIDDALGQPCVTHHHQRVQRVGMAPQVLFLLLRQVHRGSIVERDNPPRDMVKRSKSSARWLAEHASDEFVKRAQREGWRSRAVFKLAEIQQAERLLRPGMRCVDLGAAPGGWSQYAARIIGGTSRIVATDILPMDAIPGVDFVQGDFRDDGVIEQVLTAIGASKVDLVLSDMAPNMSGIDAVDQPKSMHLAELALEFAERVLAPGGDVLVKLFQGAGFDELIRDARRRFGRVATKKPKASRTRSPEIYLLARQFGMV